MVSLGELTDNITCLGKIISINSSSAILCQFVDFYAVSDILVSHTCTCIHTCTLYMYMYLTQGIFKLH